MKNAAAKIIALFVFVFVCLLLLFGYVVYLADATNRQPEFFQKTADDLLSIINLFAGAVAGALSAAFAQSFSKNNPQSGEESERNS